MKRAVNFNAGPAAIPLEVLEEAREDLLDWKSTGMSVMEVSHRSKEYETLHNEAQERFKRLAGMGSEWKILFLTGGASSQFFMLPMNFLYEDRKASYLITGSWSKAAFKEARRFGNCAQISSENPDGSFTRIPKPSELELPSDSAYIHLTSNNTIFGTQWKTWPAVKGTPLVCDMSSDIFSRPFPTNDFSLIYAGAQKNLGPSGLTLVAIRKDFLELARKKEELPTMLSYRVYEEHNSLYNTPPCFSIYMLDLTLRWLEKNGGLEAMGGLNEEKATLVYQAIDSSGGFYRNPVEAQSRSSMNVVFRLPSLEDEDAFVKEAKAAGIIGVKGHRSVGGIRFSIYNASSLDNVKTAVSFMEDFRKRRG
ncbi:MAG: 3-phosphoserine/phosphohydroxythreonine transaminase [Spirochaetia bacterium]|jgi:phosphoserine aminotransferase|nr:3-phosphoserine/phosphohydroxythreonine transaminase [Spirochaetales bacterium]MDX9783504.1 3-phosphoserine/phosphohydroxythreonine transaminase [Spirochaetia bacterium]